MVKKPAHPDIQLFEYLNGALDENAVQSIEAHLSGCEDCASAAAMIRALKEEASESNLKSQISNLKSQISEEHPDISELASFFYASRPSRNTNVAAHVALCGSCAEAIAEYARAERAAVAYNPMNAAAGAVPAKAWEMIRDWEDSSFEKLKPASEVIKPQPFAPPPSAGEGELVGTNFERKYRREGRPFHAAVLRKRGDRA